MPIKVDIAVTNDLTTDNRVHKVSTTLTDMGFTVRLTGRMLRKSTPLTPRNYATHRMHLLFKKGLLFYAEYNLRLLFRLLFSKAAIILSNDLDTLPACFMAAKLRRKKLVYDSHEYFTQTPELTNRPITRHIWEWIEKLLLPQVKNAYTVSESIAHAYQAAYGVPFRVVRNLPYRSNQTPNYPPANQSTDTHRVILYQGALNLGRGLECAIEAMQYIDNTQLWLVGDGDLTMKLKALTQQLQLNDRVVFLGRIPFEELPAITGQAHLGISVEEDLGLNYRYALPNKLFDYIQANIPVLVSNLPEMKKIVELHHIGLVLKKHDPQIMAEQFRQALSNQSLRKLWSHNLSQAAKTLNWESEQHVLEHIFSNPN